jgi:acid phosphatase (class A)
MEHTFVARPFPAEAWTPLMRDMLIQETDFLPSDWPSKIVLDPPPDDIQTDGEQVIAAAALRDERRDEILLQADRALALIWPVQRILGNPDDPFSRPATNDMLNAALNELTPVLVHFKAHFNRGRPYQCGDPEWIKPMFQRPDRLYPGHPSYPSGHSTQAHMVAYLFAEMFEGLAEQLEAAAWRVAENRVVAGLHFHSDSQAGKSLAKQVVALLLADGAFSRKLQNAKAEWPEIGA